MGPVYRTQSDGYFPQRAAECLPMTRPELLRQHIDKIKQRIAALGDLRPGALSQQYNVCGSPGCQCKATPPVKHGPYYQISVKRHGKSTTQFVREQDLAEVQTQLDNYRRLRELVDEWITLSSEISSLRIHELRQAERVEKTNRKSRIAKENANRGSASKRDRPR
jgi:hypothetical protein